MESLAVSANPFDWQAISGMRRRNLPHIAQPAVIYFLTFRLADSIPPDRIKAWRAEYERWLTLNPPPHDAQQQQEAKRLGVWRAEPYLDQGQGDCWLASADAQAIVEAALRYADGRDYWLGDYAVMPNHVHVLVRLNEALRVARVVGPWRSVSAHRINKLVGRSGPLWQEEPFDHIVRDDSQLDRIRRYIQNNPAGLPAGSARIGCGSLFRHPS